VAVGISQLHGAGIVHQDLKGSNVLLFDPVDGSSKVSDLGCATIDINPHPVDFGDIAGDPDYAPPEQKLRHISDKWDVRRIATDLYHLGSLISFYYTKSTMTSLYARHLPEDYKFDVWTGTYEEALPILKMTFATILENIETELQRRFSEKEIAADITKLIKYLCDPDPTKRGHPDSHTTSRYSMERFISIFDRLANKFESKLM
jgi:serine/threonine protein kinase